MGRAGRALFVVGIIALTSCGAARIGHQAAANNDYVPWEPLKPSRTEIQAPAIPASPPYAIPAGTPRCRASQLEGVVPLGARGYPGGNVGLPVVFRDKASTDCVIDGFPDVTVLDAAGRVLAAAKGPAGEGTYFNDGPVIPILAKSGTPALQPTDAAPAAKGQLFVNMSWFDCKRPKAKTLIVDLPNGGGRLNVAFPVTGGYYMLCDTDRSYRALNRGPFSPAGIEWPPDLHRYIAASDTMDAPASVRAGDPLVFYVTLSNRDTIDYVLDPCPDYIAFLGPKKVVTEYRLNCAPVGRIPPGVSKKFQMRLETPKDLAAGDYVLYWALSDFRINIQQPTTTHIQVTAAVP